MFEGGEIVGTGAAASALGQLSAAINALTTLNLAALDRDELLTVLRGLETQRRRLPVLDHALIGELDQRGIAGELTARTTRSLLRDVLRLSPGQAKARYDAAVDLGPRRSLIGEVLPRCSLARSCLRCCPPWPPPKPPAASPPRTPA